MPFSAWMPNFKGFSPDSRARFYAVADMRRRMSSLISSRDLHASLLILRHVIAG
jgi:hypothetical protein